MRQHHRLTILLGLSVVGSSLSCGDAGTTLGTGASSSGAGGTGPGGDGASGAAGGDGGSGAGFVETGGQAVEFAVEPSAPQTVTVTIGQPPPTLTYTATANGQPANAGWAVDQGNIGTVTAGPSATGVFTPSGTTGGLVTLTSTFSGDSVTRQINVNLDGSQNGYDPQNPLDVAQVPQTVGELTAGGGVGGVGGDGLGVAVTDAGVLTALDNPAGNGTAEGLKFLYPYDGTVWPRGLLAPNLMWRSTLGDVDAIKIELTSTTGSFHWVGTFGKPPILAQTGDPFVRHPIPQAIWQMATNTVGGADRLTVSLTVLKAGVAYGPIEQLHTIAPARLSGVIHYNSYGTQLAKNYPGAVGGDGLFGGAVLSIGVGDAGPVLTAGGNGNSSQCRVCHSVSADGTRLIAQQGDLTYQSSLYEISATGIAESSLVNSAEFPAISPSGSMMATASGTLYPLPDSTTPLPANGLTAVSTSLVTPMFSPQGDQLAFGMLTSPGVTNPRQKLVVMAFDPVTFTFSNPVEVVDYTGQPAEMRPGWPAFFPDGQAVIFHQQLAAGLDGNNLPDLRSRKGARARIAWTRATDGTSIGQLDKLNGIDNGSSYLPSLETPINLSCTADGSVVGNIDTTHANDVDLNYEPTVAPVAAGGYAWVVFTSRRMYGTVADIPPFCSDPRGVDLVQNITTKKLWVAAVDINGQPGTDASHPAFYLPGQELLAGNSRGFWVQDPCKMDGLPCQSGDECCNGFCQPDENGNLVCQNTPPEDCSGPQEACVTSADCCDPTNLCVNGFCSVTPPQ